MKHALLAGLLLIAGTAAAGAQDFYDGPRGGPGFDGPPPPDWHRPPPPDWDRPPPPDWRRPPPPPPGDDDFGYGPPRWRRPPPRMVCVAPPPPWRHRPIICPTRPGPPGSPCGCPGVPVPGHRDFARW